MKKKEEIINSGLNTIREGHAELYIHQIDKDSIPSKSMSVFYNKKMEINRDISNLAIMAYNRIYNLDPLVIMDSMAASGISSIRMLQECQNIKKIYINDKNPMAINLINKNILLNKLNNHPSQIEVSRKDANFLFSEVTQKSFIYPNRSQQKPNVISIDPFGTPNLYLDAAFKAIQNVNGLLCITATDTAVLFGVRPISCIRKYMSKPLHTEYCKEIGARILVYFISRIANVNGMGIIPLLTFYSSHFLRVFCLTFKNRKKISEFFKAYGYLIHCDNCGFRSTFRDNIFEVADRCPTCKESNKIKYAGPLWINDIHQLKFVCEMIVLNNQFQYKNKNRISKLLNIIKEEIKMPISFYNIHKLSKIFKISNTPKLDTIIDSIRKKGYQASRTHFDFVSIKTNMGIKAVKDILLEIQH